MKDDDSVCAVCGELEDDCACLEELCLECGQFWDFCTCDEEENYE
jgi:hypothetical protein